MSTLLIPVEDLDLVLSEMIDEPDVECEFRYHGEEVDSDEPAKWIASGKYPCCGKTEECFLCDPCLEFILTDEEFGTLTHLSGCGKASLICMRDLLVSVLPL